MTLPVAVQTAYGVELRVIDIQVKNLQAVANATGTATVQAADSVDPTQMWRIERLVVSSTSTQQLTLQIENGQGDLRDYGICPAGYPQVAEYPRTLTLLGGEQFTLIATEAEEGDVVKVSVQYQIVARVPGGPA